VVIAAVTYVCGASHVHAAIHKSQGTPVFLRRRIKRQVVTVTTDRMWYRRMSPVLIVSALADPVLERHRDLIRTGLSALVAHFIRISGMATAARRIGVKPVIWRRGDHGVVAVDVHIIRSRSAPG
jgi:hypothetical protein